MADLKRDFEHIKIEDGELDAYRVELAENLPKKLSYPPKILLLVPLAAAMLMYLTIPDTHFRQDTPEQIVALVENAEDPVRLGRRALQRFQDPDQQEHLNAIAVLTLTQIPEQAIEMAATGLQEDPRPQFRAFYLEFLLDNADEHIYNLDMLEAMIDKENDPLCLDLFDDLLALAT